jgi:membrane-bound lytic murein transglycosylase MltF
MEGTSYHSWLQEQNSELFKSNPVRMVLLPQKTAIAAISSNKFDFAITGADGAFWSIKNFAPDAAVAFAFGGSGTVSGWCFRRQDTDLQDAVRQFFSEQISRPDSALNANWKQYIGISLSEFGLFVASSL